MGKSCSNITEKEAEKIRKGISRQLRRLGINRDDLSNIEIEAAMTKLMTEKNWTDEVAYSIEHKPDIAQAISEARRKKAVEQAALSNNTIGKARVHVGEMVAKDAPTKNPNAVYIFTDNLQAHNAFLDKGARVAVPGLIVPEGGQVKTNVSKTSALLRTNTNGDRNSNTLGLVVKKNAQGKDGKFLRDGDGVFEDTDAEFNAFVDINGKIIESIKSMLENPNSEVTDLYLVKNIALENAGLPLRFAEALRNMLAKRLGITSQVLNSSFGKNLYGLEIQPFGKPAPKETTKLSKKEQATKDNAEAEESLKAERPKLATDNLQINRDKINILARVFPNIEERTARINFISGIFTEQITSLLDNIRNQYARRMQESPTQEDEEIYTALTRGTEAEQRRSLLEMVPLMDDNGQFISVADFIIDGIKKSMKYVINTLAEVDAGTISEAEGADRIFESGGLLTDTFALEAEDKGWEGNTLRKQKILRLRHLGDQFKIMLNPQVFDALLKEAASEIEFNENLRIVFDEQNGSYVSNTQEDIEKDEDESEGSVDNRSGLNLVKYKLLNPAKTLSVRMKTLLSHLYKMRADGSYIYNDLGQRTTVNSSVAYYILLHHFSEMNRAEDFEGALNEAIEKYPWMAGLADKLDANEDLRNEFYTAFRKIFVPYVLIGKNGKIIRLNQTANRESFFHEVTRLYEGHSPLTSNSIYDDEGQCDSKNVAKVHSWVAVAKGTAVADRMKKHPLAWVKAIFDAPSRREFNSENLLTAVDILRGEVKGLVGIEELLHSLGIPTETLDIDTLVPSIPSDLREQAKSSNSAERAQAFNEIAEILNPQVRGNISKIIQAAINITSAKEGGTRGFMEGDHLLDKFKTAYSNIADALSISSEAYTQSSFSGMENAQMFSYTAPDKISILVGIISKAKTAEEARDYIEKEWGQYDFFRDQKTGEWLNTLIGDLYEDEELRQAFIYANVLGFNSRKRGNSIQDVKDDVFNDGIVTAYYSAGETTQGTKLGFYRNPLFSDTPALVLFRAKRYSGINYKEDVLNDCVKLLKQEINRIVAISNLEEGNPEIEFFNDKRGNGKKFNYFPALNPKRAEILEHLATITRETESATAAENEKDIYLKGLISDIIEEELNHFLKGISSDRGLKILESVAALKSDESTEVDEVNYLEQFEGELDSAEDLTPEDREKKKEELSQKQAQEVQDVLTEFFYNDFLVQRELSQLLNGDIAYFKNYDDSVKRAKESYAAGDRMYDLSTDENGKTIKLQERAIYAEDLDMVSTTWTKIRDLLDSENSSLSSWEKGVYRAAVEAFKKICATDGQSLRRLDSFRKIFKAYGGKWTDNMEDAYNHIKSGHFTAADFLALWNPIKPFVVTQETVNLTLKDGTSRREKVLAQHKNSEYLITALFGVLNTALNDSPQLRGLQKFMDKYDIDVMHFHSVVKHGGHDFFDINYNYNKFYEEIKSLIGENNPEIQIGSETIKIDPTTFSFNDYLKRAQSLLFSNKITQEEYNSALEKYAFESEDEVVSAMEGQMKKVVSDDDGTLSIVDNPLYIKTFPLEDYMIVQPSDDHLIGHDALFGSQLRNIVPADLPVDFSVSVNINGQEVSLNRDDFVKFYNMLITDQLIDSFDTVERRFADDRTLAKYLEEMMRGNAKYGEDIRAALRIDPKTGTFKFPFNAPNLRNKIDELLLSSFKNNIQRQKISGGNVVLVSSFGLSNQLHVAYNSDGSVNHIPAYMPAYMKEMYQDYLVEKNDNGHTYWTLDFDALKRDNNEDILKIIGYRIPTEDKYSMLPIKIVGFMPVVAGTTIMLPADIVTMSGTDFDIDKLFLMIRALNRETYGNNLVSKFKEWINPELLKSLANTDSEQNKVLEKLLRRRRGFSDEEIEGLREKSALFDQFMESEGFSYRLQHPRYYIKRGRNVTDDDGNVNLMETAKADGFAKRDRHDIRNNMLIDTIWSVLTSKEGSKLSMLPGSYPGVKHGSRQQWIMNDVSALKAFVQRHGGTENLYEALMELSVNSLEEFYEEYATPRDPFTLTAYVKKHRNLMDGNALIGVAAVNSSNHYKLQFLNTGRRGPDGRLLRSENIVLNDNYKFYITLPGQKPILIEQVSPQKSPITGVAIGRICAEFQAASPDNGKDPTLGDLNFNIDTSGRVNYMEQLGFPPEIIGMLNTIDDFLASADAEETKEPFYGDIARIMELVAKFRLGEALTSEEKRDVFKVKKWVGNIFTAAEVFKQVSAVSRVDSPNGALPVTAAEAVQQALKIDDLYREITSPDCPILGLERLIDPNLDANNFENLDELREELEKAPIPRLQAAYTLGIKSAREIAGSRILYLRTPVLNAIRMLRAELKQPLIYGRDVATLQKFFSELSMYLLSSQDSLFAEGEDGKTIMQKRNYYIHDFPAKLKALLNTKNPDGSYKYREIRGLTLMQRISNGNRSGIKFNNLGKVSPKARKHYIEAMDSLLYNPDPEIQNLAIDLLMYAYYDNGLNFGPQNYGVFFSAAFLEALPGVLDVLSRANGRAESDPVFLSNFVYQFLLNHKELLFKVRPYNEGKLFKEVEKGVLEIAKKNAGFLASGVSGTGRPIELFQYKGSIYRREYEDEGVGTTVLRYRKTSYNAANQKNYTPFYDATTIAEDIKWDELAVRGAVSSNKNNSKKSDNDKKVPKEQEGVEGKYVPQDDLSEPDSRVGKSLEDLEGNAPDLSVPREQEEWAVTISRSMENLEQQAPARPPQEKEISEPDLTRFNDIEDKDNRLCPPKSK